MAGLADADGAAGVGDHPAAELDDDVPAGHLGRRRPRVVPDRFLAGPDRVAAARQSLRCRIFWTTTKVTSRPTAPTVAMPAGRLQEALDGVPALGLEPRRARPVGQLVQGGGQRLAGGVDLQLDLSWVARHGDSLPDDPPVQLSPRTATDTRRGYS